MIENIDKDDGLLGDLTLRHLVLLREIGRSESWTEAGDVLGLAQSTVSAAVARMERIVGVDLFEKDGTRRVPTRSGTAMIDLAGRVLADAEATWRQVRSPGGTLRVGSIDAVTLYLARDRVQSFIASHPDIDVRLTVAGSGALVSALAGREIDVAIVVGPEPAHDSVEVAVEELRIYGRSGDDRRAVLYRAGSRTRSLIDEGLRASGIVPDVVAEASDPAVLRELAALGVGWTVLPAGVAEMGSGLLAGPVVALRPVVAVRRAAGVDPLVDAFVEAVAPPRS